MQILSPVPKRWPKAPPCRYPAPFAPLRRAGRGVGRTAGDALHRRAGENPARNHRIAATNRLRYSRFHDDAERALPALAAYTGIVFKRIAPADFTAGDFEYAQAHLNITSFLYGLLRPLDAIRTYRLEGDAVLPGHGEQTVFEYWQDKLTDAFLEKIKADDGILVNLASSEMKRLSTGSASAAKCGSSPPNSASAKTTG